MQSTWWRLAPITEAPLDAIPHCARSRAPRRPCAGPQSVRPQYPLATDPAVRAAPCGGSAALADMAPTNCEGLPATPGSVQTAPCIQCRQKEPNALLQVSPAAHRPRGIVGTSDSFQNRITTSSSTHWDSPVIGVWAHHCCEAQGQPL